MALWLCRTGKHGEHEAKFLADNRIYLAWRDLDRDLSGLGDMKAFYKMLEEVYPNSTHGRRIQNSGQMWSFVQRMKKGDWVAVPSKRKTIHIGEITGDYQFTAAGPDPYYHHHQVKWLGQDIPRTNFDQNVLNSLGAFTTICQIKNNDAEARVRAMQGNQWRSVGIQAKAVPDSDEDAAADETPSTLDLEPLARDHIARLIRKKYIRHGLEDLVEAILNAQGFTTHHSGKGADGGIDILAAPGTLGFGQPRICVQVKSQTTPLERAVLDQLVGAMQHVYADQGLLICWGGFRSSVMKELPRLFFKVRLWDQNDLIDEFLTNYDKLSEDIRAEIPLKRIWTVASADGGGEDGEDSED